MEDTYQRVGRNFVSTWAGIVGEDFTPAADRRQLWLTQDDVVALRAGARRADLVLGEARRWSLATFRQRALRVNLRGIEAPEVALRRLLGPGAGVGSWVRLEGRPFRVVGLLARVGTQLWQDGPTTLDEEAWVPITSLFAFGPRFGRDANVVDAIVLRLRDRHDYAALQREIHAI